MHSRTIIIASGAVALALGLSGARSAVADVSLTQSGGTFASTSSGSAGDPITLTFSPEGFLTATLLTTTPLSDEAVAALQNDTSVASHTVNADGELEVLSSTGEVTIGSNGSLLSILTNGAADVSVQRHSDTSSTNVDIDISVNGEPVPASELPDDDITITTENTGTLDGTTNDNTATVERDIDIDVENDNETDMDINEDLNVGDNTIEGEEQDVGDIRPGDVTVDLRGLDD